MTTARQFLDEIAATLRAKGRVVEITESQESFGEFVYLYAPATAWYDRAISFNVARYASTGRWNMGTLTVHTSGKPVTAQTRRAMRIAAEVYA